MTFPRVQRPRIVPNCFFKSLHVYVRFCTQHVVDHRSDLDLGYAIYRHYATGQCTLWEMRRMRERCNSASAVSMQKEARRDVTETSFDFPKWRCVCVCVCGWWGFLMVWWCFVCREFGFCERDLRVLEIVDVSVWDWWSLCFVEDLCFKDMKIM